MSHKPIEYRRIICGAVAFAVLSVVLPAAVHAGPIFLPGTLDDGKFVPNADVAGPCYSIRYSTITATVDNGTAATKVQETVVGPDKAVRTVCLIPLPEGTDRQSLVIATGIPNGDHALLGGSKYLDADAAAKVYETIAKGLGSVKILALTGRPALLIPRFDLHGKVEVIVQLRQKVEKQSGVWSLNCPMPATQFANGPVARLAVAVNLGSRSGEPLRAIFSPTHNATVERDGLQDAVIRVKSDNWQGTDDFRLCWVADRNELGLRLLAYRDKNDPDGYFMLLGNPTGTASSAAGGTGAQQNVIHKDLIFVLDTSGSMRGEKIEQARAAIEYCL
ncbi:MAG: hypothetical protein HQ567_18190, partial [Candidatus Nealsonbacteria bacterium]|nr:hypothetical protein [Candidatus Nealsonbacteria bacterium]